MEYPTSIRYQMGYMWIINHVLHLQWDPHIQVWPRQELIPNQAAHLSIPNLGEQSRKGPPKNPGQGLAVATWILDDLFKSRHPCVLSVGDCEYDYLFYPTTYMYYKLNYYQCYYQKKTLVFSSSY